MESLCNLTHVSNANTYEAQPPPVYVAIQNPEVEAETKGTKRRPEILVNTEGQLLSNSMFLSKGGPKASNKGQNKVADTDLLSDRTMAVLKLVESLEANPPGFKGTA